MSSPSLFPLRLCCCTAGWLLACTRSFSGEEANLLMIPQWRHDPHDAWLVELVDQLCKALDEDINVAVSE